MTDPTPLDTAHAAMQAAPEDTARRLRFFERLADSELFLLLEAEAQGDTIKPEVFEVDGAKYLLVFDREERLAEFVKATAHHATLSGRVAAKMLSGQGIGLAVNPGVAPSSILIPADAMAWLGEILDEAPDEIQARPVGFSTPSGISETLLAALDSKLAIAAGLAKTAYLVAVEYEGGNSGHMLAIIDALPEAEIALAKAVSEAVSFSGFATPLDVTFIAGDDPLIATLQKTGLRFDLPEKKPAAHSPAAPGRDPENPPILR
ncbi:SseB family protein [Profundibacter amoris]|uniref:SseB family protein n=1 Tax=Profundibacter amoris TaxID=2171755 RepID=A0A347UDI0_9RHOB|nr:SseB family protein [Profundibacter amoris]AXX96908.1 SseB family protein [Profundibacter amoris]